MRCLPVTDENQSVFGPLFLPFGHKNPPAGIFADQVLPRAVGDQPQGVPENTLDCRTLADHRAEAEEAEEALGLMDSETIKL
jgi:hypothetical protein